jgi:hypothetical protein
MFDDPSKPTGVGFGEAEQHFGFSLMNRTSKWDWNVPSSANVGKGNTRDSLSHLSLKEIQERCASGSWIDFDISPVSHQWIVLLLCVVILTVVVIRIYFVDRQLHQLQHQHHHEKLLDSLR